MSTSWTSPIDAQADPISLESISTLVENMVYRLPGCDGLFIRKALQRSFLRFCQFSTALRHTFEVSIVAGTRRYTLAPPYSSLIDCVVSVYKQDTETRLAAGPDYVISEGATTSIVFSEGVVAVVASPTVICCECVLLPENGSEQCPRWFLKKFGQAITSGAMADLLSMTGRRWADGNKASEELLDFQNAITSARCKFSGPRGGACGTGEIDCFNRDGVL